METPVRSPVAGVAPEAFRVAIHPAASLADVRPGAFPEVTPLEVFRAAVSPVVMVGEAVTVEEAEAVDHPTSTCQKEDHSILLFLSSR